MTAVGTWRAHHPRSPYFTGTTTAPPRPFNCARKPATPGWSTIWSDFSRYGIAEAVSPTITDAIPACTNGIAHVPDIARMLASRRSVPPSSSLPYFQVSLMSRVVVARSNGVFPGPAASAPTTPLTGTVGITIAKPCCTSCGPRP